MCGIDNNLALIRLGKFYLFEFEYFKDNQKAIGVRLHKFGKFTMRLDLAVESITTITKWEFEF